LIIISNIFLLN